MGTVGVSYLQVSGLYMNQSTITLANGTFALDANDPLTINSSIALTVVYATPDMINFTVDATDDDTFTVTIDVGVATSGDGDPIIEMQGAQDEISVVWPTAAGQQSATLLPGQPQTLTGYTP